MVYTIMMLLPKDFYTYIRQANLNEVINEREYFLTEVILVAESEAKQYTDMYYINECLYNNILDFELDIIFNPGELFVYKDKIYNILNSITFDNISDIELAITNNDIKQQDTRNKYLKMILIDIALYHLFSRIAPQQVQELRVVRYDQAISKLEDIRSGMHGALPLECRKKDDDGKINDFIYGGDPITNNKF